ncbi:hypothetical protein ONS95_001221 [Cadophora gregata]|uniref:uncharacterized protein n=1 Tax=Cadophora gregata TaxID=51156 RepID=UPI0026DBE735|nr:uncharacterized protein ONS95_001221 [Cadophora gregata]KAK0101970.1 hypothetical protein ONS96_005940 [Cadophora gregata f. sp. sojae]KAK0129288.1 hypothetical protein ONS95_001221 [Cadophora gregata]
MCTERLLCLLRERSLGCDRPWHTSFNDTSILHQVPHFPRVNITLKNIRPSGSDLELNSSFDSISNNISSTYDLSASDHLLAGMGSKLDMCMNTSKPSTGSCGPASASNWWSPSQSSNMLLPLLEDSSELQFGNSDGLLSNASTQPNYADCLSSSHCQPHDTQYSQLCMQPHISPDTQISILSNLSPSLLHQSIVMSQPAPGGFALDHTSPVFREDNLQPNIPPNVPDFNSEY